MPFLLNGKTAKEERDERKREKKAHLLEVYKLVDARDRGICRVCGKKCELGSTFSNRVERHHVIPRSLGGRDCLENLCHVCVDCHDERHKKGTLRISGSADERDHNGKFSGLKIERAKEGGWQVVAWR